MANRAWRRRNGEIILNLRVTPNASKDQCGGLWSGADGGERLMVRVSAPPDKGRANRAALKLVARALGLPKSALSITAGEKDRLKTIAIDRDPDDIVARIEALIGVCDEGGEA